VTQIRDDCRNFRLDKEYQPQKFFEHAVHNHWDPYEDVPQELLVVDREKLVDHGLTNDEFEEAKHTQFFDRYWREVVFPVAEALGYEKVYPTDQRFFMDGYVSLFDKNETAMDRLLEADTPENRADAYCHYHLTVEGVVAQTAYYGFESAFSSRADDISAREYPNLDGLIEGTSFVRSDEGRHVGFGLFKIRQLLERGVDESVVHETMTDLLPDVFDMFEEFGLLFEADALVEYASEKFDHRMNTITDDDRALPPVERLVRVER
jgi:ribonucleoside-diphosphate reductase beta chain